MRIRQGLIAVLISVLLFAGPVMADDDKKNDLPWQKAYLNLGYYWAELDSGIKLSSQEIGIGVTIDVEDALGLDTEDQAFRIAGGWRFTKSKRHKIEFDWFQFKREGSVDIANGEEIEIPDGEGGSTIIGPGKIEGVFDFDIIQTKYEYSFFLDDRVDLNMGLGLYIMPIKFGLSGQINGVGQESLLETVTAPLPVLGLGFDFAITPKWFIRQQLDIFYLEYDNFKGTILGNKLALEYLPWKYVGFGVGFDALRVGLEAQGEDYPEIDFKGEVQFTYFGAQLFLKVYL